MLCYSICDFRKLYLTYCNLPNTIIYIFQGPFLARDMVNSTMVGIGMNPEGIYENDIVFEFMNENTWRTEPVNVSEW